MSFLWRSSPINNLLNFSRYVYRPSRTAGKSVNTHRSKRAKEGLFHGKDVQFGRSVSHSGVRSLRKWNPNVIDKRVWSYALDDWVRFKMTTRALREIDNVGGIDNYLLTLDEKLVQDSNYITKMRGLVAGSLFQKGQLDEKLVKRLGLNKAAAPKVRRFPNDLMNTSVC